MFRWFAKRYGAELAEMEGTPQDYRSFRAFFRRPLQPHARPIAASELVWPCDGKVVTAGAIDGGRLLQVKGIDYGLDEFLIDDALAQTFHGGSQATVYLAPGDYHRVHAPFAIRVDTVRAIPGAYFPVNPPAVRAVPRLFARNARVVFAGVHPPTGRTAAVVMVAALNVGDIAGTAVVGSELSRGDAVGQFGFGSTAVVLLGPGSGCAFTDTPPETVVRMGQAVD